VDRTMSAKRLIPLLDRVLVEKIVPPSKSVGGVLLPESASQKVEYHINKPTH
jgi:chaperonin GroES